MTNINNAQAMKELVSAANLQLGYDEVPNKLASSIVPVININPKDYRRVNLHKAAAASNTTSTTIYTTPTDRDVFLTFAALSVIKDAANTSAASFINIGIEGGGAVGVPILKIAGIASTAQSGSQTITLNPPIKLLRGYAIAVGNGAGDGNIRADAIIGGYIVENNQ